jgi:PEP-CTERM motif
MFNSLKFAATFGAALLLFGAGAKADLITNGNFSTTTGYGQIGDNATVQGWTTNGYNFIFPSTGGTVTGSSGNLSLYGGGVNGGAVLGPSPAGGNYIGADGAFEVGAISQSITGLTVGAEYAVSFYWGGAQQTTFTGATTEQWLVGLGSQQLATSVVNDVNGGFTGWQYTTLTFDATSTSETLSFLAVGTPSGQPPFSLLDGVSMNQVPEPASMSLFGAGLAALGLVRRRKQKQ